MLFPFFYLWTGGPISPQHRGRQVRHQPSCHGHKVRFMSPTSQSLCHLGQNPQCLVLEQIGASCRGPEHCWEALSIWGPLCPPCPVMYIIHVHRKTNGFRSGLKAATSRDSRPSNLVILPGQWAPNAQLQGWKRKPPSAFEPAPVPNLFREIQVLITL